MDKVSVIIPTYNRVTLLSRAVRSVLQQRNFAGEVIIVDDGSEDKTEEMIRSIQTDTILRYQKIKHSGPSAARNTGVEMAEYPWIAFLDSDDHWQQDKILKQMNFLENNPGYQICHTGEKWLRRGVYLNQKKIHQPRHGDIFDHCLQLCAVGMSTVMMRKSLFIECGGLDVTLPCCEDYDFWLRVSCRHNFLLLPEPLTIKEGGRTDQLSYTFRVGMDKYRIYALEKLLDSGLLNKEQTEMAIEELTKKCQVYGNGCIKHGQPDRGARYLSIPDKYRQIS